MSQRTKCSCGTCRKCKQRTAARSWYLRNAELAKSRARAYFQEHKGTCMEANRRWQKENAERAREIKREWAARNREKTFAHRTVNNAIRDGHFQRHPCEVCGKKAEAHHDDYSKPFDVRWLCHEHHMQLHRKVAA